MVKKLLYSLMNMTYLYIYNKKGGQLTEKEEKEKGLQIVAAIHNPCRRIN